MKSLRIFRGFFFFLLYFYAGLRLGIKKVGAWLLLWMIYHYFYSLDFFSIAASKGDRYRFRESGY